VIIGGDHAPNQQMLCDSQLQESWYETSRFSQLLISEVEPSNMLTPPLTFTDVTMFVTTGLTFDPPRVLSPKRVSIVAYLHLFKVHTPSIPAMRRDRRSHDLHSAPELTDQI
jgi:hypothetical protein